MLFAENTFNKYSDTNTKSRVLYSAFFVQYFDGSKRWLEAGLIVHKLHQEFDYRIEAGAILYRM